MIILGVDPGTATTGYGLIKQNKKTKSGDSLQCLGYGLIQTSPSSSPAERLKKIRIRGYGRADKKQIQEIVKNELNLKEVPKPDDAADALAIAICCEGLLKKKESQVLYNKNYQP